MFICKILQHFYIFSNISMCMLYNSLFLSLPPLFLSLFVSFLFLICINIAYVNSLLHKILRLIRKLNINLQIWNETLKICLFFIYFAINLNMLDPYLNKHVQTFMSSWQHWIKLKKKLYIAYIFLNKYHPNMYYYVINTKSYFFILHLFYQDNALLVNSFL